MILNKFNKMNIDLPFNITPFKIKKIHEYIIMDKIDIDLTTRKLCERKK